MSIARYTNKEIFADFSILSNQNHSARFFVSAYPPNDSFFGLLFVIS
ncbi:MAG: hypothetical protein US74_C0052G0004 [Parcubacteria group bacterium GW2011_GWA2_38_13]|nr:MAG: hypothetical protein US74_C0052G0004 [Parcubacteria group bacterium GW2011_GWA2_38_13]